MKRFFGYGVQAVASENGVVSVKPLSGFGAAGSGITNLQTGETAGMMPNSLPTPWVPTTTSPPSYTLPDYASIDPNAVAVAPIQKLAFTSDQIAKMFNVGPTFVTTGLVGMGTGTGTPGSPPPAAPPSGLPPGYNVYGPCPEDGKTSVAARSEAEALAMCAAKFKARVGGGDTMKYVLIGGAALVALLLLKK